MVERLTAAELDGLSIALAGYTAGERAIAELKELREQNAALVAALKQLDDYCELSEHAARLVKAALASGRGDA